MGFTADEKQKYGVWLDSFRTLSERDTGYLIDTMRTMSIVMADELMPVDGVTHIGRGSIESLVLLRSMIDGFLNRDPERLSAAVVGIQMRIIEEGDAAAIMAIAKARIAHAEELRAQRLAGDLVIPAATPEAVVQALKQRAAQAEPVTPTNE